MNRRTFLSMIPLAAAATQLKADEPVLNKVISHAERLALINFYYDTTPRLNQLEDHISGTYYSIAWHLCKNLVRHGRVAMICTERGHPKAIPAEYVHRIDPIIYSTPGMKHAAWYENSNYAWRDSKILPLVLRNTGMTFTELFYLDRRFHACQFEKASQPTFIEPFSDYYKENVSEADFETYFADVRSRVATMLGGEPHWKVSLKEAKKAYYRL